MKSEEANKTLQSWEASAAYWDKYRAMIERIFAPLTTALIEQAGIAVGQNVLDIGGGGGEPSLTISAVVGPTGTITYTDPAAGMVQSARAEAERRGLTNIEFYQCSADKLPFQDNVFDVAVSRLSVMFFPEPLTGVREILRVTRDGGRLAFVVWAGRASNPFFAVTADVVERLIEAPAPEPDAPDAFRFAEPGKLKKVLEQAGARDVWERDFEFRLEAPISFEQFWQLRTEMSESLREKLRGVTAQRFQMIREEVCEGAKRYFVNNVMSFPGQALIVSGTA